MEKAEGHRVQRTMNQHGTVVPSSRPDARAAAPKEESVSGHLVVRGGHSSPKSHLCKNPQKEAGGETNRQGW